MLMPMAMTGLVCAVTSGEPPEWHPYFHRIGVDPSAEVAMTVDGMAIPRTFRIDESRFRLGEGLALFEQDAEGRYVVELGGIEFELVEAGEAFVDELRLPMTRPVYIASHELSIDQALRIWAYSEGVTNLEDGESRLLDGMEDWTPVVRGAFEEYVRQGENPVVRVDFGDTAELCAGLSEATGMRVRLPSVAEWFVALEASGGAELVENAVVWRTPQPIDSLEEFLIDRIDAIEPAESASHMIGNVSEMVFPSDEERDLLRGVFGPGSETGSAVRQLGQRHMTRYIDPYSVMRVGGSSASTRVDVEIETELTGIVVGQIEPNDARDLDFGIRLVIELPPGEIGE